MPLEDLPTLDIILDKAGPRQEDSHHVVRGPLRYNNHRNDDSGQGDQVYYGLDQRHTCNLSKIERISYYPLLPPIRYHIGISCDASCRSRITVYCDAGQQENEKTQPLLAGSFARPDINRAY